MKLLLGSGLEPDALVAILQSLRADEEAARPLDVQAERRRAKDRERKALRNPQNSAESAEKVETPAPPSLPPQTPPTRPPTPPDITTRARGAFDKPNGFARFWEAYPNKVGKRAAEKSYAEAIKRLGGHDPPGVILAGVERAKASRKWGEGIIPNPATWLNQDRWEDQPSEVIPLRQAPHERSSPSSKLDARHANYARAFEGSERAIGRQWKP